MPENYNPVEERAARPSIGDHGVNIGSSGSQVRSKRHRSILIIGAAADIPRALAHPAVTAGRLVVEDIVALDAEFDDAVALAHNISERLNSTGAGAILMAGAIGSLTMRAIADVALWRDCELLAVMPTEVLAEHEPVVVWSGESPLVQLTRLPRRGWERMAKRTLDIVGATLGLIVAAPLLLVLALLIRLESPGSPIFLHERIGHRGRRFACLKLRTMIENAEQQLRENASMYDEYRRNHFKIPDDQDPRTTRLGRFLRRTSLDELPQLWNVLRGDMSLVGPRPVVEDELNGYGDSAGLLLSVRPGLTGAWAVNGRHDVGYPERCAIELDYIRNWRFSDDVVIVLKTVRVLAAAQASNQGIVS
jgi:lipopolysaccharide/colanic/teichoic acid biosynthesis glycosyltransferase